jgi:ribosomal protein S18 acetylase RimI-like enzyme
MNIQLAKTPSEIQKCWQVFHFLRPHLQEDNFVEKVTEMISEGYQIAYVEEEGEVVSVIGFRYLQMLFNGKQIYIDDLSTSEKSRGKGYASALLDFVIDMANSKGYDCVSLDSGPSRHTAHRLYLNRGFQINSLHFVKDLQK